MILYYLFFGITVSFLSWIVGRIVYNLIEKTQYLEQLSQFNFISSQRANTLIGIKYFKWIVENTFFKFFNQKIKFKNKNTDLLTIRTEMLIAEVGHLIGFIFVFLIVLYLLFQADYLFALIVMLVNILMNLYPSLLQQENKRRLDKLIRRQKVTL